ncbi:MAG: phage tail protein [Saprospiraceae bacterium]
MAEEISYPIPRFFFKVKWGENEFAFSEVTGLSVETDVLEYRHGNSNSFHKIKQPGMQKFGNVTFKRGTFKGKNDFFAWWNTVKLNTIERRDITITLQDENDAPVVTWQVLRAWPIKVQSPDLKSDANEVAIESIDVAHEGIVIKNGD